MSGLHQLDRPRLAGRSVSESRSRPIRLFPTYATQLGHFRRLLDRLRIHTDVGQQSLADPSRHASNLHPTYHRSHLHRS